MSLCFHLFFRFIFAFVRSFSLYFRMCFAFFRFCPRSVQQILLTGKSSHKCRSGTRKKKTNKTNAKTKQIALLLHVHLLLFCFLFAFFQPQKNNGWSCMAAIAQHNIRSLYNIDVKLHGQCKTDWFHASEHIDLLSFLHISSY